MLIFFLHGAKIILNHLFWDKSHPICGGGVSIKRWIDTNLMGVALGDDIMSSGVMLPTISFNRRRSTLVDFRLLFWFIWFVEAISVKGFIPIWRRGFECFPWESPQSKNVAANRERFKRECQLVAKPLGAWYDYHSFCWTCAHFPLISETSA